jgi:hypothetical protein
MTVEDDINRHEKRLDALDGCVDSVSKAVATIQGSMSTVVLLVKWVIVPLLVIVAGLVGIKLALP